ncbi:MAG: hypothetical protein K6U89_20315, partial [Chloroflexi bacterium]|nr:hypothetical protein [Chloroflexota bacterium]
MILWGALRTAPYVGQYGIMALRDAAIWGYSIFALIIASYIIKSPSIISNLTKSYATFVKLFLTITPIIWVLSNFSELLAFEINGKIVPILKGGELLVH